MKIAYDYQIFSMQKYGGISRYFVKLAEELVRESNVKIFAPYYINSYLDLDNFNKMKIGKKAGIYLSSKPKVLRLINYFTSGLKITQWKPDIIHETYYTDRFFAPKSCHRIVTVYDMIHEKFPEDFSSKDRTIDLKKKSLATADHIICISESTKKDLLDFLDLDENKISVIHLGVDYFKAGFQDAFVIPCSKPFLLYVGNRSGYKNFNGLLHAVANSERLKNDFGIVAFGGGKFTYQEQSLISSLGINAESIMQVDGDDNILRAIYKAASAFIYPSIYEGFGLPPLEAMSLGCPVIVSNQSSIPEVVGLAGEYFNPYESEDMCNAIESVLYSEDKRKKLVNTGYEHVKLFSWEKCANETRKIYESLL